jgi:hypothetical protein
MPVTWPFFWVQYFSKRNIIVKLSYTNKYQTPDCSLVSKEPNNTALWCDMIGNSPLCGVECDMDILQNWQQFLIDITSELNFWQFNTLCWKQKTEAHPWYLEFSRANGHITGCMYQYKKKSELHQNVLWLWAVGCSYVYYNIMVTCLNILIWSLYNITLTTRCCSHMIPTTNKQIAMYCIENFSLQFSI